MSDPYVPPDPRELLRFALTQLPSGVGVSYLNDALLEDGVKREHIRPAHKLLERWMEEVVTPAHIRIAAPGEVIESLEGPRDQQSIELILVAVPGDAARYLHEQQTRKIIVPPGAVQ